MEPRKTGDTETGSPVEREGRDRESPSVITRERSAMARGRPGALAPNDE